MFYIIYICNISFKAIESHKIIILEEYFQKPILQDTSIKGLYGYMHLENAGIQILLWGSYDTLINTLRASQSWRRAWQPTPVFLPEKLHRQRLGWGGYSPWGCRVRHDWVTKRSTAQVMEWWRIHLPMQETGDVGAIPGSGRSPERGNSNPLWYSCPKNPMDRKAWWATVYGVTKSRTQWSTHTHTHTHTHTQALENPTRMNTI